MKRFASAWLPDDEQDKVMLGAGTQYQGSKLRAALKYLKHARTALDIGAHCGLWTVQLGAYFNRVECFEPLPVHIECWQKNAAFKQTCTLHPVALGEKNGRTGIAEVPGLSGRSHVEDGNTYEMRSLDSYALDDVDFVKIDVEGYEYFVIKGGEETLRRCKPVMVVEQKPKHGGRYGLRDDEAIVHLTSMGWRVREEMVGDFILTYET